MNWFVAALLENSPLLESYTMQRRFAAKASITINASTAKIWGALTNPELIKKYLYGTEAVSEWKVGSSITYRGIWQGKPYEDKGKILQLIPERLFQSTYWSSMGGFDDKPENYATVTYELEHIRDDETNLTVSQDNIGSEKEREHSEKNWGVVLETMKNILEK
ncbi:MAG: SRPBCC domain-containing protein [Rhabdochlamydiaceae bacterium]